SFLEIQEMGLVGRAFRFRDDTKRQRLILGVTLTEAVGDLGTRRLDTEVEGMPEVRPRIEVREKLERVVRYVVPVPIVNMDAVFGHLDAIIWVADLGGERFDFLRSRRKPFAIPKRHQSH